MSVDDPIFKGHAGYGSGDKAKGDVGKAAFSQDVKVGPCQTKCNMDKSHGKPSK